MRDYNAYIGSLSANKRATDPRSDSSRKKNAHHHHHTRQFIYCSIVTIKRSIN